MTISHFVGVEVGANARDRIAGDRIFVVVVLSGARDGVQVALLLLQSQRE